MFAVELLFSSLCMYVCMRVCMYENNTRVLTA